MRNGWYINEREEKCTQSMIFPDDYPVTRLRGQPKGIKRILEERNLWPAKKIRLVCERCSEKNNDNPEILNCCAWRIMSQQPDFCEQRSILDKAVTKAGHIFERYPKFHCECNFIERYWSFAKRETR
ncbi:3990_t:CDS:1 [Ambispora gerdemannii]|uniref:3990_t:CDS:1 n=1 Tax=Ambispora gerdemannii TaxID=144530 RepID=A0A9N9DW13_9GLOM|nr:3990_t:CDS:1 [Ambispora gerdemannii]